MKNNLLEASHPTWGIYDSSKIQEFMQCPRKYFYRYILGWEKEDPNIHLVFGESWHRAMEVILQQGGTTEAIQEAYSRFLAYYRTHFSEIEDANNYPKVPAIVVPALVQYSQKYSGNTDKVLYTEIAGTVPIRKDRAIHFRLDSVIKGDKGIYSLEHKTGSRLSQAWLDQWNLKFQVGTYTHVLYCIYDRESVYGVRINGAIFRKKDVEFIRVPVRKDEDMMNAWLWTANYIIDLIEWNMEELRKSSEEENILMCFPMNTETCMNYGRMCAFHDFCSAWANPLRRCSDVPSGFEVRWWNPADREEEASNVMHLKPETIKEDAP